MNVVMNLKKKAVMFLAAIVAVVCVFAFSPVYAHAETGTANTDGVNVRAAAVDGELVGSLSSGTQVTINEETTGSDGNTWYNITFTSGGSEVTGYVRGDFLDVGTDADTDAEAEETEDADTEGADEQDADAGTDEEGDAEEAEPDSEDYAPVADNSGYVVASSIPEELYPDGFSLTNVDYEGSQVTALKADNADVYLIYVERADDPDNGKLVIYDTVKSELIPFIQFFTDNGYIILLNIPSEELLRASDRFVQTTCTFSTGTMDAMQLGQVDDLVASDISIMDYYYMYGVDQDGTYGWYVYNSADGTIQKNTVNMQYVIDGTAAETEEPDDGAFSITDIPMLILIVAGAIFLLLLILVIVFAVRYHRLVGLIDEDEEEEEDDDNEPEAAIDDIAVGQVRTTRPTNSAGENTMDMYDSFSEALEKMAAQETAAAGGAGMAAQAEAPKAAPAPEPVKPVTPEPAPAAESVKTAAPEPAPAPAPDIPDDDDDDDFEFL